MPRESLDWVRRAYDAFNRRDWGAIDELLDPAVEWRTTVETFSGHEGVRTWVREADELFEDFAIEIEEVVEAEDRVVVLVHESARGRESGVAIEMRIAHVWTLRDGRAVAMHAYAGRAEALAAVGAG